MRQRNNVSLICVIVVHLLHVFDWLIFRKDETFCVVVIVALDGGFQSHNTNVQCENLRLLRDEHMVWLRSHIGEW